jgi:hypothetical protein
MKTRQGYWDHKTKPSTFVVLENDKQIYRGSFKEGYELLQTTKREYHKEVTKYFTEPLQLTPTKNTNSSK